MTDQDASRQGEARLSCTDAELVGLLGNQYTDHERTQAALDVKNREALVHAMHDLEEATLKASRHLGKVMLDFQQMSNDNSKLITEAMDRFRESTVHAAKSTIRASWTLALLTAVLAAATIIAAVSQFCQRADPRRDNTYGRHTIATDTIAEQ